MPRKKQAMNEVAALYADVNWRQDAAMAAQGAETRERLLASTRSDMGGAPVNQYRIAQNYQQRVQDVWAAYATDPLFGRLVNRFIEFSANGSSWEVPTDSDGSSWIDVLSKWMTSPSSLAEREEEVWNLWSTQINKGVPNVLPGINEIVRWAVKHMLLGGMFVPHWKLGELRVGKQSYIVPTQMTCYPSSTITLSRSAGLFVEEEMYYYRPNVTGSIQEGQFTEAPNFFNFGATPPKNMLSLPKMVPNSKAGDTEAFALKYNWSPGDLTAFKRGTVNVMGTGVYPTPPFFSLLPQFAIRQKLFASDAAILDGLINYIMMYKIGDKDHPPQAAKVTSTGAVSQAGTIETVRTLIQSGRIGPAMEMFVPYYVNLEILMPDTTALLSDAKYGSSATEILQAFGIFFSRTASGSRERMEKVTLSGFEEFIGAIRFQVKAFLDLLAWHIVELNKGKLKTIPNWSPNPINTKSEQFLKELLELKKFGMISAKTLLRFAGIDDGVEIRRIVEELASDTDDVFQENVPVSYVQQAIQPDTGGEDPEEKAVPPPGPPASPKIKPKPNTTTDSPLRPRPNTRKTIVVTPGKQRGRPPK